jgi:hypothetical protein
MSKTYPLLQHSVRPCPKDQAPHCAVVATTPEYCAYPLEEATRLDMPTEKVHGEVSPGIHSSSRNEALRLFAGM